jgi:hypothetical protein
MSNKFVFPIEAYKDGIDDENARIIEILTSGDHVWQLDLRYRLLGVKWKQKCRCGFYGVFNDHLVALVKGEK